MLSSCNAKEPKNSSIQNGAENMTETSDDMKTIQIIVNGQEFEAELNDSKAAKQLMKMLPLELHMTELNGNEKYYLFSEHFDTEDQNPKEIHTGDLMIYASKYLVLFYDDFKTSYKYTSVGKISDTTGLKKALGTGDADIVFKVKKNGKFDLDSKTVTLNSGYKMPVYGIGTYSLLDEKCVDSVLTALENGVHLIDTAYMYHNEESVGKAVRQSGIPREEIFVTTKLYPNQYAYAEAAIEESLKKLDLEYIDLLLLHHPGSKDVEAYHAMERAVAQGKVRSIGLSNWYVKELEDFLPKVDIKPSLVQNEIHPYYQENDVIPYIQELGIVVQGWYPLGGRGYTAELLNDKVITGIAKAHKKTAAQIILRWNLQKGVVVIPGSSNPDHIRENTQLFDFELTEEEMAKINSLDRGEKHDWY